MPSISSRAATGRADDEDVAEPALVGAVAFGERVEHVLRGASDARLLALGQVRVSRRSAVAARRGRQSSGDG